MPASQSSSRRARVSASPLPSNSDHSHPDQPKRTIPTMNHSDFLNKIRNAWRVVWLAAHVERSLKRDDFEECPLKNIIQQITERQKVAGGLTLRQHGHLILGAARVLFKKLQLFDERLENLTMEMETSREIVGDEIVWEDDGFYDMEYVQQGRRDGFYDMEYVQQGRRNGWRKKFCIYNYKETNMT